jgi:MYXO-CTERM domain-containing protein
MNAQKALGAIGALTISTVAFAGQTTPPTPLSIHVGQMKNTGWGTISYTGDYRTQVTASKAPAGTNTYPTLITIDLSAILSINGFEAFSDVTVVDSGLNAYGGSPGADIDYFAFTGLPNNVAYEFAYLGPNPTHLNESAGVLGIREALIDTQTGNTDNGALAFVSLGLNGKLTANMSGWTGGGGQGPGIPTGLTSGISLMLSEAGSGESFDVYVTTANVPAPGALALLGMAGLLGRRGRRRR